MSVHRSVGGNRFTAHESCLLIVALCVQVVRSNGALRALMLDSPTQEDLHVATQAAAAARRVGDLCAQILEDIRDRLVANHLRDCWIAEVRSGFKMCSYRAYLRS